jgi:predicted TIM-barrel fold metal-dependent hydrolase
MIPACPGPLPPVRPKIPTPPKACDTHAHVFGPGSRFPYAETRSYTPPDAPLEKYLRMLDTLGFARDALRRHPKRLRGVAVADETVPVADLRKWDALGVRALRFNHFFRDGKLHYQGGVTLENAKKLGAVMKDLGWHMQLWIDVKDLPDTIPIIQAIGLPVVIDHMGRTDARAGINTAGFQSLVRLLGEGGCWVKMSGAHRLSTRAPDYPDARPFHEALIAANPDQLIWGTDWPHPRIEGEMPNAGHLLDLFNEWTPDAIVRRKILADNPARLYGFPDEGADS